MKRVILFIAAIGCIAFQIINISQAQADPYGYEYEHKIPADYVYRTEETREPSGTEGDGFNPVSTVRKQRGAAKHAKKQADEPVVIHQEIKEELAAAVKNLANQLLVSGGEEILQEFVLAVSTFVNLNHLYMTSSLGRYLSEQMLGELQRAGVPIIDVRKAPGLMISEGHGEYILSRDMKELSFVHPADAIVVGTYSMVENRIYINVRLLKNDDGLVLASGYYESPIGKEINQLLADEGMPVPEAPEIIIRELKE